MGIGKNTARVLLTMFIASCSGHALSQESAEDLWWTLHRDEVMAQRLGQTRSCVRRSLETSLVAGLDMKQGVGFAIGNCRAILANQRERLGLSLNESSDIFKGILTDELTQLVEKLDRQRRGSLNGNGH